jgi:hypothetical protein
MSKNDLTSVRAPKVKTSVIATKKTKAKLAKLRTSSWYCGGAARSVGINKGRPAEAAADRVPAEKRGVFVGRIVARLQLQHGFTDADLDDAVRAALTGLVQSAT